ncbi:polysaccharide lyase family 8 protein [Phellopilus nigrolimitatus]|nr:polysaccharide lyase family 8 protein [Phellopilus nigrolimitatus]
MSGSVTTTVISTPTAGPSILADINTIHVRRLPFIISSVNGATDISAWLSTLGSNGQWPASEIDYTNGCSAQRANWPAEAHWQRIVTMSAAFHGGLANTDQWVNKLDLRAAISLAMDFWFSDDFTNIACLDSGGLASCPCGTPGFWDPNWFSNIIGIPELVGQSCLLLNSTLTSNQLSNCTNITGRAYATFDRSINGVGTLTGANTLDVASIGIDLGILTVNASQIADAYKRVHNEVMVQQGSRADGIRPDGSFGQHAGIIYNGNYGKDYTNDVLALEIEASGTQFEADLASKEAFMSLISGDEWMIYRNVETDVLHWDFSVLGRFISFPVADNQATASIKINITELQVLGEEWDSDTLTDAYNSLSKNTTNANAGSLNGNRIFYDNDYMVQRGPGYVTSLRMYSTRTTNTECINSQNPFGFHLSDGTIYTYMTGSEYEDIAAAWDFNLIPGTTVDYNATRLSCSQTGFRGLEAFVGGASTGRIGMGAMRYTNPLTQSLHWQKAWFFFEGGAQHVVVTNLSSAASTPVFSVLDQRKHVSAIYVDGVPVSSGNFTNASSLWHGDVGYIFSPGQGFSNASGSGVSLSVDVGLRTGNWSALGISTQPPPTVDLFAAWIEHTNLSMPVSYTAFPAVTFPEFLDQAGETQIMDILNDGAVSAVLDVPHKTAMAVFWEEGGGNVTIPPCSLWEAPISLSSDKGLLMILEEKSWMLTVADPTQIAVDVEVVLQLGPGTPPKGWGHEKTKTVSVVLPTGITAGSSISVSLNGTSVQRML